MGILFWTVVGLLTGWITNQIFKIPSQQMRLERIVAGIAGGLTGGLLSNVFFSPGGIHLNFQWQSTVFAMLGATIIILVGNFVENRKRI
jgi:uncharacterized membrane protein YeaQ/YmgE (transglycosylase-associated protein family)